MGLFLSHLIKSRRTSRASLSGCAFAAGLKHAQKAGMSSVGSGSNVVRWAVWSECSQVSGGEKVVLTS